MTVPRPVGGFPFPAGASGNTPSRLDRAARRFAREAGVPHDLPQLRRRPETPPEAWPPARPLGSCGRLSMLTAAPPHRGVDRGFAQPSPELLGAHAAGASAYPPRGASGPGPPSRFRAGGVSWTDRGRSTARPGALRGDSGRGSWRSGWAPGAALLARGAARRRARSSASCPVERLDAGHPTSRSRFCPNGEPNKRMK